SDVNTTRYSVSNTLNPVTTCSGNLAVSCGLRLLRASSRRRGDATSDGGALVKEGRFRWAALTCGLLCLMSGLVPVLVKASSIIVPDAFPSIQSGLNSAADTVFVRSGTYAESPIIARQGALLGMPGEAPPVLERPWSLI